jgi:hypothetical protein
MNIFAREVVWAMRAHGFDVGSRYAAAFSLPLIKVRRLCRSLTEDITAILNDAEMQRVDQILHFLPQDWQRIRAALVAESIHRLLVGRADRDTAQCVADLVFNLLTTHQTSEGDDLRQMMVNRVRDAMREIDRAPVLALVTDRRIAVAFEQAEELSDRALLWLARAREAVDMNERTEYLLQAHVLLNTAHSLATFPPAFAVNTEEQRSVLADIDAAERAADRLDARGASSSSEQILERR